MAAASTSSGDSAIFEPLPPVRQAVGQRRLAAQKEYGPSLGWSPAHYAAWGDEERRRMIIDILSRRPASHGVPGTLAVLDRVSSFAEGPPLLGPGATLRLHPAPSPDRRARGGRWRVPMPESWVDEVAAFVQ